MDINVTASFSDQTFFGQQEFQYAESKDKSYQDWWRFIESQHKGDSQNNDGSFYGCSASFTGPKLKEREVTDLAKEETRAEKRLRRRKEKEALAKMNPSEKAKFRQKKKVEREQRKERERRSYLNPMMQVKW